MLNWPNFGHVYPYNGTAIYTVPPRRARLTFVIIQMAFYVLLSAFPAELTKMKIPAVNPEQMKGFTITKGSNGVVC